jgi:hypothetical protein
MRASNLCCWAAAISTVPFCATAQAIVEALPVPVEITLAFCKDALEQGRIISQADDGTLTIQYAFVTYFVTITAERLTCRAVRY